MKKRNIFMIFVIALILLLKNDVYAANTTNTCTKDEKQALLIEAQNVAVTYEMQKGNTSIGDEPRLYYYNFTLSNVSKNLYVRVGQFDYTYRDAKNGEILIERAFRMGGAKVKVQIFGNSNSKCNNQLLHTIKINLPYYNMYSEREECQGYEDYNICKSQANTEGISEEEFKALLDQAKEDKKNKEKENDDDNKEEKSNIFNLYWENRRVTIPVTIVIIILIGLIIIKVKNDNKKKVKIDLGDKR